MKTTIHLLVILFCISLQTQAQSGETKGWPSVERVSFIRECVKAASKNMGIDTARFYCYCMQEKVEAKYPTVEESSKLTAEMLSTDEWLKEVKACLKGFWNSKDRNEFLTNCISAAKSLGEEKATKYCECMLFKVEKKYPNSADAAEITEEVMNKPEWQKMIKGCLSF